MITNTDVKKLKEVFATKEEVKDVKTELKADILNFRDQILHEIIKLREDLTIVIGYRDMIEDHENRIGRLEVKV